MVPRDSRQPGLSPPLSLWPGNLSHVGGPERRLSEPGRPVPCWTTSPSRDSSSADLFSQATAQAYAGDYQWSTVTARSSVDDQTEEYAESERLGEGQPLYGTFVRSGKPGRLAVTWTPSRVTYLTSN